MNYNELQDFIKAVAKSGATEVRIETDDLKLTVKTEPKGKIIETIVQQVPVATQMQTQQPAQQQFTQQPTVQSVTNTEEAAAKKAEEVSAKYIEIKAPMVGTFYRKPAPGKPTFVNIGDRIEAGKTICIIEAMKLFNEIEVEPGISGTIVQVLVDDSTPVEFDQPLFLVDPS